MTESKRPAHWQPRAYALRGICFIRPKDTHEFSGSLRLKAEPGSAQEAWKVRLDTWRNACAHRTGEEAQVRRLAFDPARGTLSFRVNGRAMVRPVDVVLRRLNGAEWIGTWELVGLPDEPKYVCRVQLAPLPETWESSEGVLETFAHLEARARAEGRTEEAAAKHAQSPVVRGPHRLNPAQILTLLRGAFGKHEVDVSAERVAFWCHERPPSEGAGPWDPFSLREFEHYCVKRGLIRPFTNGGWLEGLVDPFDNGEEPATGGGWLVRLPDGMIGITEGFLAHIEEWLSRQAR